MKTNTVLSVATNFLRTARFIGLPPDAKVDYAVEQLCEYATDNWSHGRLLLVKEFGTVLTGRVKQSETMRERGRCYNNSIEAMYDLYGASNAKRLRYVEGVVMENGVPIAHAWNRVGDDEYEDCTILRPESKQYMGLYIPTDVVLDVATKGRFGTAGEGVLGCIATYGDKKRSALVERIRQANKK